ncbi:MAG: hypothetical protein EOO59_05815 [Hymenobacter sp.]|nr:MAG: hypothetical protein EOO59_05815 [Hymenobacter sp.]
MPYLRTAVENGVLHLSYDNPNDRNGQARSRQRVQLLATVTADELTALEAGSGSLVTARGDFDAADFKLEVSSGALVKADIATTTLAVAVVGVVVAEVQHAILDRSAEVGHKFGHVGAHRHLLAVARREGQLDAAAHLNGVKRRHWAHLRGLGPGGGQASEQQGSGQQQVFHGKGSKVLK